MSEFRLEYENLAEEIAIGAAADGELKVTEFFKIYAALAAENGDSPDLEYTPVISGASLGYRVDGYAIDLPDEGESAAGDFYFAVCLYFQETEVQTINAKDIEKLISGVERFIKFSLSSSAFDELEEASPAFKLACLLRQYNERIARVRVLVLTNAHLKTRKKVFPPRALGSLVLHTNVFDLERYVRIAYHGSDPVEVNFNSDFSGPVACLPASSGDDGYQSYLFALHGPVLAEVFATYGNRLLEQNVRTYLQAKTSVNKGILKTIASEPAMFFAYNNGLTATASAVTTELLNNGTVGISSIKDFQIVNGGQTTASLLYARDGLRQKLDDVYVQCKLSVVDGSRLGELVPKISACANTQNKVSLADLAANSPAQSKIERLAKEINTPIKAGSLYVTRWFYERSRGQYRNMFSYKSSAERARLELQFPKHQLIEKTDLAKSVLAYIGRPHHVSEGAQKCFNRFANTVLGTMSLEELHEKWFRDAVAKTIIFNELDRKIAKSGWYLAAKGLKAQTVAYTVSATANAFRINGMEIDLERIWQEQEVPENLLDWALKQAEKIHIVLTAPPDQVKDAGEFCKKEFCWELYVKKIEIEIVSVKDFGISLEDTISAQAQGRRDGKKSDSLDFEITLAKLVPRAIEIRRLAEKMNLISDVNLRAMQKLEGGRLTFNKGEKNALRNLLERLEISV
jgi:hypothetical protein